MKEWMGMGSETMTVECKAGVAMMSLAVDEPRGDGGEKWSRAMSNDAWMTLWMSLESARWRELAAACPDTGDPNVGTGITDLELELSDGTTTKKLECSAMRLSSQHGRVIDAFEKAAEIVDLVPST
ncbi:MAG TPA: hypothetical protein VMZ53_18190 [Kofleriaceae bacterium]|nr:hypothetical protein [Kofleriaceae bacterium]